MKNFLFISTAFLVLISCGSKKMTPEIFLIPSGYCGTVKVVFEEPCGQKETLEDKKRIYIIPENGILISQFKQEFGILNQEYYYVDAKGERTLIPKMMLQDFNEATTTKRNENEPPRDQVGIFEWGSTGASEMEGRVKVSYYIFHVGTYTEVRDSFTTLFQGNGKYEHAFDSTSQSEVNLCRTATTE